jgi:hypothetical protein
MTDLYLANQNFKFLKELKPYYKITVDTTTSNVGVLQYDNRWLQSVRRTLDGTTRQRLLITIEHSFNLLSSNDPLFCSSSEQQTLIHISDVMKKTSPSFHELHGKDGLLNKLLFKSRNHEAQRKAHELFLEKGVNNHIVAQNPDYIVKEVSIDESASSGLISRKYPKSPATRRIALSKPDKVLMSSNDNSLIEDDESYYCNNCCFTMKRKLK